MKVQASRIRMLVTVMPDFIFNIHPARVIAIEGNTYPAYVNQFGAVSVVLDGGIKLGVRTDEFEVIEWEVKTDSD